MHIACTHVRWTLLAGGDWAGSVTLGKQRDGAPRLCCRSCLAATALAWSSSRPDSIDGSAEHHVVRRQQPAAAGQRARRKGRRRAVHQGGGAIRIPRAHTAAGCCSAGCTAGRSAGQVAAWQSSGTFPRHSSTGAPGAQEPCGWQAGHRLLRGQSNRAEEMEGDWQHREAYQHRRAAVSAQQLLQVVKARRAVDYAGGAHALCAAAWAHGRCRSACLAP